MKRKSTCYTVYLTPLLLFLFFSACPPAVIASSLSSRVLEALSDQRLQGAEVSVHVVALDNKEIVFSQNAERPFIPASNQKILTTIAALDILGEDYEFLTSLWMKGKVKDGVLHGNLILLGGGDPTLGSPAIGEDATAQFNRWAQLLKNYGITKIEGDIIVDESLFDNEYIHPEWPENQLFRHYSAPVSAFIFHDNCTRLTVRPGASVGEPAIIEQFPAAGLFHIENTCRTSSESNTIIVDRKRDSWQIRVNGDARRGNGGWSGLISVPDPAIAGGKAFAIALQNNDIGFTGEVLKNSDKEQLYGEDGELLLARRRAPLKKALEVMLVDSQNLYAESILKLLGAQILEHGSWENGAEAASAALKARGLENTSFKIADASGYSRNNRITAQSMCKLLMQMHETESNVMKTLLPTGGTDGTLRNRFTGSAYAGRINAKSGYIARVGALSGYVLADSGRPFAFSIMFNNFRRGSNWDMRQIQDAIVKAVFDEG